LLFTVTLLILIVIRSPIGAWKLPAKHKLISH
jgi:hypothetical protein